MGVDSEVEVGEGRGWSGDKQISQGYRKTWTIDDLVAGKKEDCLVSITAITPENKWFDLAPFSTLTIDINGVNIEKREHH